MTTLSKKKKTPLHPDVAVQKVLLVFQFVLFLSLLGIFMGMLLMMAIGAYQVISALYFAFARRSVWHQKYLLGILAYGALIFLLSLAMSNGWKGIAELPFTVLLTVVPYGLSFYYYFGSKRYHRDASTETYSPFRDEEVLDDFMLD